MLTLTWVVQIVSAILLIILILLHSPKGEGLAGMGGASNLFSSQKSAETGLNKLTMYISIIFVLCTFLLGFGIIK